MRFRLITLLGIVTVTAVMTAVLRVERDLGTMLLWSSWTAVAIHVVERTICRGAGVGLRMCGAIGGGCIVGALLSAALAAAAEARLYDHRWAALSLFHQIAGVLLLAGVIHGALGGALFGMMQGVLYIAERKGN